MKTQSDPQTYAIIGAAMEVHGELGRGFLEPVYQEAFEKELIFRRIPHQREAALPVFYKKDRLSVSYRVDFLCFDKILVELKALDRLTSKETAIALNYLKTFGLKICLLLNFGTPSLEYKRFVN